MWSTPNQDPGGSGGGGPPNQPPNPELEDLKDQFEQQQVLISQLKEMLRKNEQTVVTQEKVEEFANKLSRMNARAKQSKMKKEGESGQQSDVLGVPGSRRKINTPANEKINLLRQQLEENKAKLAERGKNQKGIEEMVIQLKAQLDDSQNLINQSPLNLSAAETLKIETYTPESSSQELYKILIAREKHITDLTAKVQKLEANVLDLQENIKEKDQVIDARTKAITLMSENLSKKGKHTLDALDDTKEQMRKMQENFVQLEADMQQDKQRLLLETQQKDIEIANLKEANSLLEKIRYDLVLTNTELQEKLETQEINVEDKNKDSADVENYLLQINSLNKQIEDLQALNSNLEEKNIETERLIQENEQYSIKVTELEKLVEELKSEKSEITTENDEVAKLKKQLDESNKQMIKIKAQSKSKIKELNKKIDGFKKLSDSNAEIVRLQAENSKLEQRITELEEQTASEAVKDSTKEELQQKLDELQQEIEKRDEEIAVLKEHAESDNSEIVALKEEVANLTHLQNAQVKSQLDSIAIEEQLEKAESEKQDLLKEKEEKEEEVDKLNGKIEVLIKEKQEISNKLESYMQENMELIDKLEKLSAEKVSSAESIEIVEALTQQEKLELEAYQKSLDLIAENIKTSDENLVQNLELNESVNQLTEETSELLQKIELFTIERREVMERMEALTQENNSLSLKLKEIENNRDVLIETYEQLQNEKEKLEEEIEHLRNSKDISSEQNEFVHSEAVNLEKENSELKILVDRYAQENKTFENEISELKQKLTNNSEELANYKAILEENKSELISSASTINDLQTKLNLKEEELKTTVADLQNIIDKLEEENRNMAQNNDYVATLERQLQELKIALTENMEEAQNHEKQLQENSKMISELNNQLNALNKSLLDMEHELNCKNDEIHKRDSVIGKLQEEIRVKDEKFHSAFKDIKEKYQTMQLQIEQNAGSIENIKKPFEEKVEELTAKNKEQLEKMKKIAANLKKKSAAYQELEEKYVEVKEKWENESKEKDQLKSSVENKELQIVESEKKISSLLQQLHEVEDELSKVQSGFEAKAEEYKALLEEFNQFKEDYFHKEAATNENTDLQQELSNLQAVEQDLRSKITQYENQISALVQENEKLHSLGNISDKEEQISALNEQILQNQHAAETRSNALEAKIQELELYIETQDLELNRYKERVNKLEEGLANVEERRLSLERTTFELGLQLQEKSESLEEISQTEDILEMRLKSLENHDKAIEKRLQATILENQELTSLNQNLIEQNSELKHKINMAHNKISEILDNEKMNELEAENSHLKNALSTLEMQHKNLRSDFEQKLREKGKEVESAENDSEEQFYKLNEERKHLLEQIERLSDQIKDYEDNQEMLRNEIEEHREKLRLQQNELQDLIAVNTELKKISENKSQSEEIDRLKHIISEKEKEVEEYQRQNLQLQMQNSFAENAQFDVEKETVNENKIKEYQEKISSLEKQIEDFKLLLKENAEKAVNEIVSTAVQTAENYFKDENSLSVSKELQPQNEALILNLAWPEVQEDPFKFIAETSNTLQSENKSNAEENLQKNVNVPKDLTETNNTLQTENKTNTEEELQKKIKALEFMLYTVEKEKDDAVLQCHELSKELTRLVYERENVNSQVVENEDLVDNSQIKKELSSLEFAPVNFDAIQNKSCETSQPVQEDIIAPKTAYLCYDDKSKQSLESQIVQTATTTSEEQKELHSIEFEKTKPITQETIQNKPVKEDKCQQKQAYLCYDQEQTSVTLDSFGENDDGWAWGPEEAKLEEEHRIKKENSPENIATLTEKIKALELEKDRHLEELRQSQIKSGKLIKKLKEFKTKNEQLTLQLSSNQPSSFGDLDDAIQEELKQQISGLEKQVREISAELSKERAEKDNLKKRIDVLTAANERMVEMKEKQDIEILSWQQRNRELASKLDQFDWGDDGFNSPKKSNVVKEESSNVSTEDANQLLQRIQELNDTIKELSLDNEELQALLNEQQSLRLNAEKSKNLEPKNAITEAEYSKLLSEKNNLHEELNISNAEKKNIQDELNRLIQRNDQLSIELNAIRSDSENLKSLMHEKDKIIEDLNGNLSRLQEEYNNLIEKQSAVPKEDLLRKIQVLEEEKSNLHGQVFEMAAVNQRVLEQNDEILRLHNEIKSLTEERDSLYKQLQEKQGEISLLKESVDSQVKSLKTQLDEQNVKIENLNAENAKLLESIKQKDEEFELKMSTTLEQISQEWTQRVDQRGNDVAESWKLHLESRENEFTQLQQQLQKDIYDLEEKCNGLVNENNELRKNVDAEIRNEVDRMSALQQQINDKQQAINELTVTINQLRSQVQESNLKITDLETTLIIKQQEISEKQQTIDEFTKKIEHVEALETELNELKNKLRETETENSNVLELQSRLKATESRLTESNSQSELFKKELEQYKTKVQEIQNADVFLQQKVEEKERENTELNMRLQEMQSNVAELHQQVFDCQQHIAQLQSQLQEKLAQIEYLNSDLQNSQELLQTNELATAELNALLEQSKHKNNALLESQQQAEMLQAQLVQEREKYTVELAAEKESSRALLQEKDEELLNLRIKIEEITRSYEELQSQAQQVNLSKEEANKQTADLQAIIEDQVLKIEELKKELFAKSNDYDALIAELDMRHRSEPEPAKPQEVKRQMSVSHDTEEDDLLEPVSRAELDLALYMLHQRDVRCEELTMELMQLLEERDTLQLRLSNAIREKEELRSAVGPQSNVSPAKNDSVQPGVSTGAVPKSKAILLGASGTELATEVSENLEQSDKLANKLSELRTVGYRKDKTIVDEKELRRLQELSIMQQHRDVASKLPPEAAARLVDANYTLSRDVQSPSKVLLNWLWGRSTPRKVNDD